MSDDAADVAERFLGKAAERGLPSGEAAYWIRVGRPAAFAAVGGEGPLVARMGGEPLLPDGAPEPCGQFAADVDCALLPPGAAGLPLPAVGHLLMFGDADVTCAGPGARPGRVIYVAPGTPVTTRPADPDVWPAPYPLRELRTAWHQLSWPDGPDGCHDPGDGHLEGNDALLTALNAAWSDAVGWRPRWNLQLGGHANSANWDPVEVARDEYPDGDWALLATWSCGEDVSELDFGLVHWVIRRQDLAVLRFDRVYLYVDMH